MLINSGLKTRREVRQERYGDDWSTVVSELAAEKAKLEELGLDRPSRLLEVRMPKDEGYKPNQSMANAARKVLSLEKQTTVKAEPLSGSQGKRYRKQKNLPIETVKDALLFLTP